MRCRFVYRTCKISYILFKCNIESKAGYGVDLWGDIDCGTDISILLPAVFGIIGIWWSLAATQVMMHFVYQIVKELKITVDRTKKVDYSIL